MIYLPEPIFAVALLMAIMPNTEDMTQTIRSRMSARLKNSFMSERLFVRVTAFRENARFHKIEPCICSILAHNCSLRNDAICGIIHFQENILLIREGRSCRHT